jgi:hypothetical protein
VSNSFVVANYRFIAAKQEGDARIVQHQQALALYVTPAPLGTQKERYSMALMPQRLICMVNFPLYRVIGTRSHQ